MTAVRRTRPVRLVVTVLAAAAGLVGLSPAPASAALCSGSGVNVVVDFNGLGGGVQQGCDRDGAGQAASRVFPAAGFALTYAQRQPGFVCRVKGVPTSDTEPCQNTAPADAYWGLYWSDGKSGTWTYSSAGVGGVSVPSGGFVAFSWQDGGAADPPGVAPVNRQQAPSEKPSKAPTKAPAPAPANGPGNGPGGGSSGGSSGVSGNAGAATPTAAPTRLAASPSARAGAASTGRPPAGSSPSASPSASASQSPTASPTASEEVSTGTASAEQVDSSFTPAEEHSDLPTWVPIGVVGALTAAAGGLAFRRRRRMSG